MVASTDARPTAQSYVVFDTLSARLDRELAKLKVVMDTELSRVNAMLRAANLTAIVPSTAELGSEESVRRGGDEEEYRERKW
ncbi:MAG: hypothetical protein ACREON_10085 [Gemmatimonadaceae bacterium]